MKIFAWIVLGALLVSAGGAAAATIEIQATQIATIAPADRSASPRLLVSWQIPADLAGKIIDAAVVSMVVPVSDSNAFSVDVMPVTRSWSAATADWNSGWSRAGGDFYDSLPAPAIVSAGKGGRITVNVLDAVLDHVHGRRTSYGFIVVPDAESGASLSTVQPNDPARLSRAKLIIGYRNRR